jgi:hypothetical protein
VFHRTAGFFRLSRRELLVLALLFVVSLPAVTTRIYSSDEVQYFSYLRSLWFDRDVSFENEYRYFHEHDIAQTQDFHEAFLVRETATGRRINFGTIGSAILWSPFYAAADAGVRVARLAGSDVPADGFAKPYVAAVAYGSSVYGFLAVLLGIGAARRLLGDVSVVPAVTVWIGTPLLFYMYVAPPFAHATSAFAVALFVTVWLHVRRTWPVSGVILVGLAGALMTMVREQDVFFVAGPVVDFAIDALRTRGAVLRQRMTAALAGAAAFVIGWLPQLLAYQALNGRPGPSQYVTRKMYWHSPHALQVLFDPSHGFFFWTPLAALALAGLTILALQRQRTASAMASLASSDVKHWPRVSSVGAGVGQERPAVHGISPHSPSRPGRFGEAGSDASRIAAILLLMVALQVYVSGAVESWTVAGAFGQRRFVAVTIMLIVGLSALWRAVSFPGLEPGLGGGLHRARPDGRAWGRRGLAAVVLLCLWWNLGLMALFGTRMMDRQRIDVRRNAYDAFVTLPRMAPALAWRYVTARETFYDAARGAPQEPR